MPRICEVCGRVEEGGTQTKFEILDVCAACSDHLIHPTMEMDNENQMND